MLMIKDIPENERPRERFLKEGKEVLSNSELLAIILKTGVRGENVKELANKILRKVKDIKDLRDVNKEVLMSIKGIGEAKAIDVLASIELGRRIYEEQNSPIGKVYNNSKVVYDDNKHLFIKKKQEYFYCIYLNNKKEVLERKLLFMGTVNKSLVHPREIFKEAHLLSASSIICIHNHPGGDLKPSMDDIILTTSLVEIGKLQQIPIVDHLIISDNGYYSFYENKNGGIFSWIKEL